jgi:hypothetical protein
MPPKKQKQKQVQRMSEVESVHQTESSIGTEQIKEKASQNTKNVFSRMLSRSK